MVKKNEKKEHYVKVSMTQKDLNKLDNIGLKEGINTRAETIRYLIRIKHEKIQEEPKPYWHGKKNYKKKNKK